MVQKKRRTRKHVIADMSLHHVAYHLVKANCTIEPTKADYGYDGTVFTFDRSGQIENGTIFVQLKATDSISRHQRTGGFAFPVNAKDLALWLDEPFPVYLILFDAQSEQAYWLYVQEYFTRHEIARPSLGKRSLSVLIDRSNRFDSATPRIWRSDKTRILRQLKGLVKHA